MVKLNFFVVPLLIAIVHAAAIGPLSISFSVIPRQRRLTRSLDKRTPCDSCYAIARRGLVGDILSDTVGTVNDAVGNLGNIIDDLKRAPHDSGSIVARQNGLVGDLLDNLVGTVDGTVDDLTNLVDNLKRTPRDSNHIVARQGNPVGDLINGVISTLNDVLNDLNGVVGNVTGSASNLKRAPHDSNRIVARKTGLGVDISVDDLLTGDVDV